MCTRYNMHDVEENRPIEIHKGQKRNSLENIVNDTDRHTHTHTITLQKETRVYLRVGSCVGRVRSRSAVTAATKYVVVGVCPCPSTVYKYYATITMYNCINLVARAPAKSYDMCTRTYLGVHLLSSAGSAKSRFCL